MIRISADVPLTMPPSWAVWERRLLDAMEQSVYPFLDRYTREDGEFVWKDEWGGGSCDDFYEPFFNWSLVYAMGGGDHLLELADRQWAAITRQLTRLGAVSKEYAIADDQFHQSESDIFFYYLCLANPDGPQRRERARRFAGFFLNEDPEAINYDPEHKIILSDRNGSTGAYYEPASKRETATYAPVGGGMERYGIPFFDLPGITDVKDLADPEKARIAGQALFDRWGKGGDSVPNMAITSLVTNAFLLTGEEKYRDWVLEYTDAWVERARENGGLLPDSVGLSGKVGEYVGGKWYGGRTGWTFPHGFYNIQMAAQVAASNAFLLTRDDRYLELPRRQFDRIFELGETKDVRQCHMSLREHWIGQLTAMGDRTETLLVPYRYGDAGWFDWQPMSPIFPVALWNLSMAAEDWERIQKVRSAEAYDWGQVVSFRNKEDAGHEPPWSCFLAGEKPSCPEEMLSASYQQVCRRLALIRENDEVDKGILFSVHHWQETNPLSSEALVQLTLGAPQPIYNGGLLHARLRYFDADRRRPGLPLDVGALVEKLEAERTVVRLVNLNAVETRCLILQAGALGEHRFGEVRHSARASAYPGEIGDYCEPRLDLDWRVVSVEDTHLAVELPPATEITLDLATVRFVNEPSYAGPF